LQVSDKRQWVGKRESEGHNTDFREMAMKRYWMFVVVGYVLLLAALGFALDLGIVAMLLRS
jgi:hypothetical protein